MSIEWNGEGLPPVGCECEAKMPRLDSPLWGWRRVKVVISGMVKAENECLVYDVETTRPAWADEFRPIRTEEERKREEVIKAITDSIIDFDLASVEHRGDEQSIAIEIYCRIEAGRIPHVTLK